MMIRTIALVVFLVSGPAVAQSKSSAPLPIRVEITDMHVIPAAGLDIVPVIASAYVDVRDLPMLVARSSQGDIPPPRHSEVCRRSGCRQIKMPPPSPAAVPAKLPDIPKE